MRALLLCFVICLLGAGVFGHSASEWRGRVIYQVLTDRFAQSDGNTLDCDLTNYCGGTWKGIERKLDYISGMGFNAIWISPIVKNRDGGYHGYWFTDLYSLNDHFGTEDDLLSLVEACHKRDIWVMLDVVGNHAGITDSSFEQINPFNDAKYYHPYCIINDWNNQTEVEVCRLAGLCDLDQSNWFVESTLVNWIGSVVKKYGFDGIRIDTAREVPKPFWTNFTKSANVYSVGEVEDGRIDLVAGYQGCMDGTLNYPLYFTAKDCYANQQSLFNLQNTLQSEDSTFSDINLLGIFSDNHDQPRFLNLNKDWNLLKNYLVFNVMMQGIPIIYYGTEQGYAGGNDPQNRETLWPNFDTKHDLYVFVSDLVKFYIKNDVAKEGETQRYADDQFYAFTRGKTFVATSNIGSGQQLSRTITYDSYEPGTKICNVLGSECVTVGEDKSFTVTISNGLPGIYVPTE